MLSPEVAHVLKTMQPGTHTMLVYDSPENKHDVLFTHLKYGENDSKLAYVCSEETPNQIRANLKNDGMDVKALEHRGRLSVANYDEVYIRDGYVDIPRVIDHFSTLSWRCLKEGLRSLRAGAEMSCFIQNEKMVELADYERALGREFPFPAMGICAFNVVEMQRAGYLDRLMPLLMDHGTVILTGPKGSSVLNGDRVKDEHVEKVMHVRISSGVPL
jgi:hypothetical protein